MNFCSYATLDCQFILLFTCRLSRWQRPSWGSRRCWIPATWSARRRITWASSLTSPGTTASSAGSPTVGAVCPAFSIRSLMLRKWKRRSWVCRFYWEFSRKKKFPPTSLFSTVLHSLSCCKSLRFCSVSNFIFETFTSPWYCHSRRCYLSQLSGAPSCC